MSDVADLVWRAAHLGALTLVPTLLTPEPEHAGGALGVAGTIVLAAPVALSIWLRRAAQSLESSVAAVAWVVTAAALVIIASAHTGEGAPLLRGYYAAAPFVFVSLALSAASLAGHFLGPSFKNKRVGAAVIVLGAGLLLFRSAHEFIASPDAMIAAALARNPGNVIAFRSFASTATPATLAPAADACLAVHPDTCPCLAARAELRLRRRDRPGAVADSGIAKTKGCGHRCPVREAGSSSRDAGDVACGDRRLRRGRCAGEIRSRAEPPAPGAGQCPSSPRDVAISKAPRSSPRDAMDRGAGRDAQLLLASLWLAKGDVGTALQLLETLTKNDPNDPDAVYDLALANDMRGDFNPAREGYLKALRLEPDYRSARYNLAVLTLRQGIVVEARHHALEFAARFPDDPRAPGLIKLTGASPGAK